MDMDRLRAFWAHRQGLDGALRGQDPAAVLERAGWARSVGGGGPYLTLFPRAGTSRPAADAAGKGGRDLARPAQWTARPAGLGLCPLEAEPAGEGQAHDWRGVDGSGAALLPLGRAGDARRIRLVRRAGSQGDEGGDRTAGPRAGRAGWRPA